MKFKPKNKDELYRVIKEIVTNQIKNPNYSYGLKDDSISTNFDKYLSVLVKLVYVSLITNMSNLFSNDENYINHEINNQIDWNDPRNDITSWNVSNVTNMTGIFINSSFNQPIGNWNVSNVTNMNRMFNNSMFNQPIDSWNVSNVIDMEGMFYNSQFNQDISKWILKLNKNCIMSDINFNSKHRETYGKIVSYENFIKIHVTKDFIKETLQNGNDIDKFKLLKILKQNPNIFKNINQDYKIMTKNNI